MRIAISGFGLGAGKTGIATYFDNLVKALANVDQENAYDILIPEGTPAPIRQLPSNFKLVLCRALLDQPILNILWHNTILPLSASRLRYNLVHVPTIRRIPLLKACPTVVTIHDMAPFILGAKYDRFRTFYHRQILSRLIHRCDEVITVSHATKRDIVKFTSYPADKITVIYSGIDHSTFHPCEKNAARQYLRRTYGISAPFFVYVSRIEHPGKNHVALIEAYGRFKASHHTDHELILVGSDWTGANVVKQAAAASPYRSSIRFLGFVPTEDVVRLYSTCDLMVFPSLYEGFGFPVLEAMTCGAVVACSNSSALAELAGNYALTFDPNSPEAIAEAMISALRMPARQEHIDRARAYSAEFSWTKTAEETIDVYKRNARLSHG